MKTDKLTQALQRAQALLRSNDAAGAVKLLEQTVKQQPKSLEAWFMLGQIQGSLGQHEAAMQSFTRAIKLNGRVPEAHFNLGLSLRNVGDLQGAVAALAAATKLRDDYTGAWYNLGATLLDLERYDEAEQAFLKVLRSDTSDQIYMALGISAQGAYRYPEAIAYYHQAQRRGNNSFTLHLNLGTAYYSVDDYENALTHSLAAHQLNPPGSEADSVAIHNIAFCYLNLAEIEKALEYYSKSRYPYDESAYLYALNFVENYDADRVFQAHKTWGKRTVAHATQIPLPARDPSPVRRLRIAYLSADWIQHPVSIFLEQVLKHHDHEQFEIFCYSDVQRPDHVTARLKTYVDHWRDVVHLDNQALGALIREDGIDILIDISGHTSERSCLVATRHAPIQVNYLGHVSTSGLSTVDYRFTDALVDPPGEADRYHTEKLVRLGNNFFSYNPPAEAVDIGPLPALRNGYITFVSFNRLYKLNERTIGLWSKAMKALPDSRILMLGRALTTARGQARALKLFESHGISAERIEFESFLPLKDFFAIHNRVDLIMDCFPWNGHTTTMQSLWMGVPTVTFEGQHHAGRFGYAIMSNLGLPEFIAENEDAFVDRVVAIANDRERLAEVRQGLRQRIRESVLSDHVRLTRDIEENYRKMWTTWLAQTPPGQ